MALYYHNNDSMEFSDSGSNSVQAQPTNEITLPSSILNIDVAEGGTVANNNPQLLAWIAEASATNGSVTTNVGDFPNFAPGSSIITFSSPDATNKAASFTVTEILAPVITAPASISVDEGVALTFDIAVQNFSAPQVNKGSLQSLGSNTYRFTHTSYTYLEQQSDIIVFTADDGINSAAVEATLVTVVEVDNSVPTPVIVLPASITTAENTAVNLTFSALNATSVTVSSGSVTPLGGDSYRFDHGGYNFEAGTSDVITFTAINGGEVTTRALSIIVTNVLETVISNPGPLVVNTAYGDGLTLTQAQNWANQFNGATSNTLSGYSFPLRTGSYPVVFTASDAAPVNQTITVNESARPNPTITITGVYGSAPNYYTSFVEGTQYVAPTAMATDADGNDISGSVSQSGFVNIDVPGSYTLTYYVSDSQSQTATTVLSVTVTADPTKPTPVEIMLLGVSGSSPNYTMSVLRGGVYTPPIAQAVDLDGNVTQAQVMLLGDVDTQTSSTYTITASIDDEAFDLLTPITLTVTVVNMAIVVPGPRQLIDTTPAQHDEWEFDHYEAEIWPYSIDFGPQAALKGASVEAVTWSSVESDVPVSVVRSYHDGNIAYAVLDTRLAGPGLVKVICRYDNGEQRVRYLRLNVIAVY